MTDNTIWRHVCDSSFALFCCESFSSLTSFANSDYSMTLLWKVLGNSPAVYAASLRWANSLLRDILNSVNPTYLMPRYDPHPHSSRLHKHLKDARSTQSFLRWCIFTISTPLLCRMVILVVTWATPNTQIWHHFRRLILCMSYILTFAIGLGWQYTLEHIAHMCYF